MPPTLIKRIKSLRRVGVFSDYNHAPDTPDFKRLNLIYGFNGSGKTTLSRILRSIEVGKKSPLLPSEAEFAISFVDANDITHSTLIGTAHPDILVFNEDFIEENLRWRDGRASPVYFIGKEQARLSELVERLTPWLTKRERARDRASNRLAGFESQLALFKRERARAIAEELNLGRRYNATNLEADYAQMSLSSGAQLTAEQLRTKKELINRISPASFVSSIQHAPAEIIQYLRNVVEICRESFGAIAIEELKQHAEMLKWVKDGLDYHKKHHLESCLFCGNEFSRERSETLKQSIDDRFEEAVGRIRELQVERTSKFDELDNFVSSIPDKGLLEATLSDRYENAATKLQASAAVLHRIVAQARNPLDAKTRTPNVAVDTSGVDIAEAVRAWNDINVALPEANACIDEHNRKIANFENEKAEAAEAIKIHHLKDGKQQYADLQKSMNEAQEDVNFRRRLVTKLDRALENARQGLRSHGLAIGPINKMLASYLGHSELTLASEEEGYQIHRSGKVIAGPLSEGEKTALALCYFLSKLEENGRKKKDVIAILDDPISSLDSKALNYAASLVRLVLSNSAQLIILTHNLQFMNEVKKWLKPLARADDNRVPTASLLFLNVSVASAGERRASLQELPKLLRDYDSEYHYLCSLIFKFVGDEGAHQDLGYILPNVLRKVLELFLNFKNPGPDGLGSKLNHASVKDCGLDQARIRALHRLADAESHGDNLDDVLMLSPMTVEEVREACAAFVDLMKVLDAPHFERMKSLCT